MGYNDDWESLMNSVFGPGGRMRAGGTAKKEARPAEKPGAKPAAPKPAGSAPRAEAPDLNKALLEQQKTLDKLLKKQNEALRGQDASTRQALEESRQLLRDMEADGLLAQGAADIPAAQLGSFEGLAAEVKQTVLGQDDYVDALVRAMRRPFVLGTDGQKARNVILLWGPPGTGRHFALEETARRMAARGLLQSGQMARMDLALYPDPGAEKLFLQDLYAALNGPGEMVLFDHYESCCPAFLRTLASLAVKGAAPLASRYLVNREGILIDAGTALAARLLNDLARLCARQLKLTLSAGEDVRDYVAGQHTGKLGAAALSGCCERIFRALSEYCLRQVRFQPGTAALEVRDGVLCFSVNGSAPAPLADLLPAVWDGGTEEVRQELDALVGLDEVKEYVFGLADNVRVQKRRAAAGLKTASLSMHMIFTGNPGTGKTTIARLVARYLKAIGALRGGQLVEVSRGDLVGRYTGHTAPLTNSVIESALGGVLFIDEAYSLYRGEQDSFGLEAIDTLVKGMEDHREDLVVILAGYTREMEQFLTANSGLASRFPNQIEFPDYTADQLLDITASLAAARGYRLDDSCTFPLLGYYQRRQAADSRTAGNGRLARNTLEKAIYNQSRRLVAEPDAPLDLIQAGDLEFDE